MQLNVKGKRMETNYGIKLPNDSVTECTISYKLVSITIGGTTSPVHLIQFHLSDFDIISGMNWLYTCGAKTSYEDLKVILKDENGREVCFYGLR